MYNHDKFRFDHCKPNPAQPMGCAGEEQDCCGEPQPCVVPPPIPPVRYVPGMNVQEQMCNMANQVNVCINRWNQIQAKCYETLDNVVGAAYNNDVYYTPDEVRYMEGYDEDSACAYALVEARAVDKSGKPIFCHLRAAYNNETNSGARENIADVSFVTSGQMVMTAVQATETHWNGTTVFNCNPGAGNPDDTVWVAGWNRNGVLRFFRGDVGTDVLRQNRMVNCIGPVFPVIKAGQLFEEATGSIGDNPGSIQAMGWKNNGNKVFFSCSNFDQPGMTPQAVAKILQRMGCMTAVITSYQVNAVTAWDTMPAAGTENVIPAGGSATDVISAPGMTGGMTFLGKLTTAPIQWSVPQNCAAWVISKRPPRGWQNAFTTEIANVVQRLGNQENSMNSILSQLQGENDNISKLENLIQQNTNNIDEINGQLATFDGNIKSLNSQMSVANEKIASLQQKVTSLDSELKQETQNRINGDATLKADIDNEALARQQADTALQAAIKVEENARIAADNALQSNITSEANERKAADNLLTSQLNQETSERKSADTVLQNNINEEASKRQEEDAKLLAAIDSEATTRAQADRNLQAAIEAEQSARSTKDTQHEARMDAIEAQEQKDIAGINEQLNSVNESIENIKNGTDLPVATADTLGAIKIGDNLVINDGVLSAVTGGEAGDKVTQGPGIVITGTGNNKTISIDDNVVVNEDELKTVADRVTAVETKQADQAAKDQQQDEEITNVQNSVGTLTTAVENANSEITKNAEAIETATTVIQQIQNGEALPIATTEKLGGVKIGANLSISEDGTLSASAGEGATGETVAQGAGIEVTHNTETNVATVALDAASQAAIGAVAGKAEQTDVDTLKTTVAGKADKQTVTDLQESIESSLENISNTGAALDKRVTDVEETDKSQNAAISSLNSATTALTQRLGTAEQNVDALTTQQTKNTEDIGTLKEQVENTDTNVTHALDMAAAAEEAASQKVDKSGDTMTGALRVPTLSVMSQQGTGTTMRPTTAINKDSIIGFEAVVNGSSTGGEVLLTNIGSPQYPKGAANKEYVDAQVAGVETTAQAANVTANEANVAATEAKTAAEAATTDIATIKTDLQTMAEQVDRKVNSAGDTMTGPLTIDSSVEDGLTIGGNYRASPSLKLTNKNGTVSIQSMGETLALVAGETGMNVVVDGIADPVNSNSAVNKNYVDTKVAEAGGGAASFPLEYDGSNIVAIKLTSEDATSPYIELGSNDGSASICSSGGAIQIGNEMMLPTRLSGVAGPMQNNDAVNKAYADGKLSKTGGTVTGAINIETEATNKLILNGTGITRATPVAGDETSILIDDNLVTLRGQDGAAVRLTGIAEAQNDRDAVSKIYMEAYGRKIETFEMHHTESAPVITIAMQNRHNRLIVLGGKGTSGFCIANANAGVGTNINFAVAAFTASPTVQKVGDYTVSLSFDAEGESFFINSNGKAVDLFVIAF